MPSSGCAPMSSCLDCRHPDGGRYARACRQQKPSRDRSRSRCQGAASPQNYSSSLAAPTAPQPHAVRLPSSTAQVVSVAEPRSVSSTHHLSQRAQQFAPLPSCRAPTHSHSLIEGVDLPLRNLRLRPSRDQGMEPINRSVNKLNALRDSIVWLSAAIDYPLRKARAVRTEIDGVLSGAQSQGKDPYHPLSRQRRNGARLRMILACGVNAVKRLFVRSPQDPAGLRVHQMCLCAREARHLDVGECIFKIINGVSPDVLAGLGTAVEERPRC
jgi:hypothetical protein